MKKKLTFDEMIRGIDEIINMRVETAEDFWAGQDVIREHVENSGWTFDEYLAELENRIREQRGKD